ncbi:MAG: hypothetical protein NTZ48_06120 [Candidatus Omnitrophica bacterium]|nr:hypothetical protein [Candidatus Omnitrophota bacterium]
MKIADKKGKLVISDFNEFDAYRMASKVENDGIDFYRKFLGSVSSKDIAEAIGFLVQEEKNHLKFFQECLDALRQGKEDPSEDNDLLESMDYGIFLPGLRRRHQK